MTTATQTRQSARPTGHLNAAETADAAVTAALVVALLAAGRILAAGSLFQVVASFVVAVLAARRRSRAVVIATCAASAIALILGGLGPVSQAALAGVFGWCVGQGLKRGWGRLRTVGLTLLIGWPAMAASVMFFYPAVAINKKLRELVFENVENQAIGMANILSGIGNMFATIGLGFMERALTWLGTTLVDLAGYLIDNWILLIPATQLVYSTIYAFAIRAVAGGVLRRLERALTDPIDLDLDLATYDAPPHPVPLRVRAESLLRNGTPVTGPIELSVDVGEHVVIEGPNGSGKSTLLDALAGLDNIEAVIRPGAVGLGRPLGTARVGQRPEAQVVGTTVDEDLRWGLTQPCDVSASLAAVGLELPLDRPTSELSGGELQRLALASALERRPQLLLADEVTSMLDPAEQKRIIDRLDALEGAAIIRTTHRDDAAASDRRIQIGPSPALRPTDEAARELSTIQASVEGTRIIRLREIGFAHNHDQPWAHRVLDGVNLSIHRYEMVIIEGRNGSGKSTLARLLAGLDTATEGTVERTKGAQRALAHQHVRLQLLKPTVEIELSSLSGVRLGATPADDQAAGAKAANLATAIGLFELGDLLHRRIDELSGGEQRRVLLAGLVARGVSLLVLDEPLAGLDAAGRQDLAETLDHVRLAGTSVVVVSHDVDWSPLSVSQRLRLEDGRLTEVTR